MDSVLTSYPAASGLKHGYGVFSDVAVLIDRGLLRVRVNSAKNLNS